jgi:subtilisin family serine protease
MKKTVLFLAALALVIAGCTKSNETSIQGDDLVTMKSGDIIPGQYVILLKSDAAGLKAAAVTYVAAEQKMADFTKTVLKESGISEREPLQVYASAVEGFAVNLTESEAATLAKNPNVEGVWADQYFVLAGPQVSAASLPAEQTPPGITRVGGGATYTGTHKAWIIDTGVDLDHSDLHVNTTLAKSYVTSAKTADDDNGHGTHCAGIIAAIDNTVGVVGVAAGAYVVPVKVLDRSGSGSYSNIIKGCDYVSANATAGDVVNMSLGGSAYTALDNAIIALGAKGIFVAVAAGNNGANANNYSPARANGTNVYTISACNASDVFASWSNYGNPPVDYCAPGVSIYSLYKNNSVATMSGTSMATPHAAGVLLATGGNPASSGTVTGDPDGNADPIIHE